MKWIRLSSGNWVYGDPNSDFYISFRPKSKYFLRSETAIVTRDSEYYILDGDFRKDYQKLYASGLDLCLHFYENNKDKQSVWSSGSKSTDLAGMLQDFALNMKSVTKEDQ
jgi:hypothetical protein